MRPSPTERRFRLLGIVGVVLLGGVMVGGAAFMVSTRMGTPTTVTTAFLPTATTTTLPQITMGTTTTTLATTTTTVLTREPGEVPGWTVGRPWGSVNGLSMFRGNPTRTWYGTGPLPDQAPEVLWTYPTTAMCGSSVSAGEAKLWCGTGWTGQPVVWERPDGVTEVIFGAYDKAVHFVDADTGESTRDPFKTGDIIKGSVTLDPDGYPLLYFGSRDNKLRALALDTNTPTELWSFDANEVVGIWNNDWDGNPVVIDGILYVGGENGWFFAIRLDRSYDEEGLVSVEPEVLFQIPGWTAELLALVGRNVSIESSVAVWGNRVYFANSGGRVVGLDMSGIASGEAEVVFDYWVGDDVDATVVIDVDGMLYVAVEYERRTARADEIGQLVKLDPFTDGDPLVWGLPVPPFGTGDGGLWATPALGNGHIYAATHTGRLLAVDSSSGEITWEDHIGFHAWSSPLVIDDLLVVATCELPEIRAYSLDDPALPVPAWTLERAAGGCIESTPAVWNGRIYVGSRDGYFRAYGR